MSQSARREPSALQSVLAGAAAGGAESLVTYPTEYVKTRQQLARTGAVKPESPLSILSSTIRRHGPRQLYAGAGAFCVSNASKSGIRFLTFDFVRRGVPQDATTGKRSAWGNLLAGMAAGIAESVAVVTPGETLKTKIIDDRAGPRAYRSGTHAIRMILAAEGPRGLYRGVVPVTLKQSANAMVRFTSYNSLLGVLRPIFSKWGKESAVPAIAGAIAGCVTVYATMPFDNVKTKLQAIGSDKQYSGSWHCFRSICTNEGPLALWRGTTPRLIRLSVSGAISFSIYEQVIKWTTAAFDDYKGRNGLGLPLRED